MTAPMMPVWNAGRIHHGRAGRGRAGPDPAGSCAFSGSISMDIQSPLHRSVGPGWVATLPGGG